MNPENPTDHLSATAEPEPTRRPICANCSRPSPVCLCQSLPARPIPTKTQIVIVHHPHEAHHKLSTVPVLTKCLLNSTTIVTRRLRNGPSPLLDQSLPAIYLFPPTPSSPAVTLSQLLSSLDPQRTPQVLIVFDGTWKHAKEMVSASEGFLSRFATRVCLDYDESASGGSIYDSELILRKEPCGGCVSTMEAVARALRVLEPNGSEIESKLIEVLREMVKLQARYLKPMKPRPKLLKKGKEKKELTDQSETSDLTTSY
ncbi:tRNA-uridine aminocarboxypropyltransferase A [Corylus avellana]|uniref:tRNA-uridine aminocarboxypropyltransferase A n=1 Tax=Corylus avellana TaxID=13451 RepID=UPI001E20EC40|nr:tRNA-uridine aminocarboxypropyltransferase A [Corylus avellana]